MGGRSQDRIKHRIASQEGGKFVYYLGEKYLSVAVNIQILNRYMHNSIANGE